MRISSGRRWCPTPQQLMILDHLYTRGLKTPTASQIQKITAHLSLYGDIQGKNVFYWFQNHKARDRHKLRLHYHRLLHHPPPPPPFLPFQGCSGVCEVKVPQATVLRPDYPTIKDCLMRATTTTYDHDSTSSSMQEVSPTIPCFRRSHQQQPLQTLELFPLTASSDHHQKRASP